MAAARIECMPGSVGRLPREAPMAWKRLREQSPPVPRAEW